MSGVLTVRHRHLLVAIGKAAIFGLCVFWEVLIPDLNSAESQLPAVSSGAGLNVIRLLCLVPPWLFLAWLQMPAQSPTAFPCTAFRLRLSRPDIRLSNRLETSQMRLFPRLLLKLSSGVMGALDWELSD